MSNITHSGCESTHMCLNTNCRTYVCSVCYSRHSHHENLIVERAVLLTQLLQTKNKYYRFTDKLIEDMKQTLTLAARQFEFNITYIHSIIQMLVEIENAKSENFKDQASRDFERLLFKYYIPHITPSSLILENIDLGEFLLPIKNSFNTISKNYLEFYNRMRNMELFKISLKLPQNSKIKPSSKRLTDKMQAIYSDIQSGINALDLSTKYHITPSAAAKYLKESEKCNEEVKSYMYTPAFRDLSNLFKQDDNKPQEYLNSSEKQKKLNKEKDEYIFLDGIGDDSNSQSSSSVKPNKKEQKYLTKEQIRQAQNQEQLSSTQMESGKKEDITIDGEVIELFEDEDEIHEEEQQQQSVKKTLFLDNTEDDFSFQKSSKITNISNESSSCCVVPFNDHQLVVTNQEKLSIFRLQENGAFECQQTLKIRKSPIYRDNFIKHVAAVTGRSLDKSQQSSYQQYVVFQTSNNHLFYLNINDQIDIQISNKKSLLQSPSSSPSDNQHPPVYLINGVELFDCLFDGQILIIYTKTSDRILKHIVTFFDSKNNHNNNSDLFSSPAKPSSNHPSQHSKQSQIVAQLKGQFLVYSKLLAFQSNKTQYFVLLSQDGAVIYKQSTGIQFKYDVALKIQHNNINFIVKNPKINSSIEHKRTTEVTYQLFAADEEQLFCYSSDMNTFNSQVKLKGNQLKERINDFFVLYNTDTNSEVIIIVYPRKIRLISGSINKEIEIDCAEDIVKACGFWKGNIMKICFLTNADVANSSVQVHIIKI